MAASPPAMPTGDSHGEDGEDFVGGLVGYQEGGLITSSYATGESRGGVDEDNVGGLVGYQNALITSSYAIGYVDGGSGDSDNVGGLVGHQNGNSLTSSYATGYVDGGEGTSDSVGGLVGYQGGGLITSSYGFGTTANGDDNTYGTPPTDTTSPSGLTQANSGDSDTNRWSVEAWDFGTSSQEPALKYVDDYILGDHDSDATTEDTYAHTCTSNTAFLPSIDITCGTTLLPKQPSRICSDAAVTDSALLGLGTAEEPFVLCSCPPI